MNRDTKFRARRYSGLTVRYVALTVCAVIIIFPLYIIFLDSMLSATDITRTPPVLFSVHLNFGIFATAWRVGGLGRALWNSVLQTTLIVVGQLVTSIMAAFAFAYLTFPFKRTIFLAMLATLMIPFEVTVITNLDTVNNLHLYGNIGGLVVPALATGFGIFLLRYAFEQIPREMREAAVIDGYSDVQFMRRVAIPMARPTIGAVAVFGFLGAWNSYLWPAILTTNNASIRTLPIQIKSIMYTPSDANLSLAASAIAVFPLIVLLIFFQKQLIRSLTAGAVK